MNALIDHSPFAEIAGVIIPWFEQGERPSQERIGETSGLVEALGCDLRFVRDDRIRKKSPSQLISPGILSRFSDELRSNKCTIAIVDGNLTPIQQRNLEKGLELKVIDRTGLILEIFGLRARTKEGVLQVELARLAYERSRLVRTWTHLERQRGGRGFLGGPGETQLEADKRMLDRTLKNLKRDLEDVQRTRLLQRAGRRRKGVPVVALVGYTNAGKSTLFNRLVGASVFTKDMPFATLDPTIRQISLPNVGEVAIVDTVGFISQLPTHLIESFKATLEETMDADLLIHVRDRSSLADKQNCEDVETILGQLEQSTNKKLPPMIEVWNKADLLSLQQKESMQASALDADRPAVLISAVKDTGLKSLTELIEDSLKQRTRTYEIKLIADQGRARAWLYEKTGVISEQTDANGDTLVVFQLSEPKLGQLQSTFPELVITPR